MDKRTVKARQRRFLSLCMALTLMLGMLVAPARADAQSYDTSKMAVGQVALCDDSVLVSGGYLVYEYEYTENGTTKKATAKKWYGESLKSFEDFSDEDYEAGDDNRFPSTNPVTRDKFYWEYTERKEIQNEIYCYFTPYYFEGNNGKYVITLNANGGKIDKSEYEPGVDEIYQSTTSGKLLDMAGRMSNVDVDKVFAGWNTVQTPSTDNPGVTYADGANITPTGNITLYAQWEEAGSFTQLKELIDAASGTLELGADYYARSSESENLYIDKALTIDLKGHTINGASGTMNEVFSVGDGGDLTVKDTGTGGTISGGSGKQGVYVDDGGTFTLESGKITGCGNSAVGINYGGVFNMNGGEISGNSGKNAGGVFADCGSQFCMNDGVIKGNSVYTDQSNIDYTGKGGGVFVAFDDEDDHGRATFDMSGGTISDNTAEQYGGGVYVGYKAPFMMTGGTISGNTAEKGGGVYVDEQATFTMMTGSLSGGGSTFGEISANTAENGGGVFLCAGSALSLQAGEITGNTAYIDNISGNDGCGGGVCIAGGEEGIPNTTLTMSGGEISGNRANNCGGGVYMSALRTAFNISGAPNISGNIYAEPDDETGDKSNVHLNGSAKLTVDGTLGTGAYIGVSTDSTPTLTTPVAIAQGASGSETYTLTSTDAECFESDSTLYEPALKDGSVVLNVAPARNVPYINESGVQAEPECESATIVTEYVNEWGEAGKTTWYVVEDSSDGTYLEERAVVTGDVRLILADGAMLIAEMGITVGSGSSLTIYAQSAGEDMGMLYAGTNNGTSTAIEDGSAGIGGDGSDSVDCGAITICGGNITAIGGTNAAGIGGGAGGEAGSGSDKIKILGGCVKAIGGGENAAGIGEGSGAPGTNSLDVSLSWMNISDSITSSGYSGRPTLSKDFVYDASQGDYRLVDDDTPLERETLRPGYKVKFDPGDNCSGDAYWAGILADSESYTLPTAQECGFEVNDSAVPYTLSKWRRESSSAGTTYVYYDLGDSITVDDNRTLLAASPTFTAVCFKSSGYTLTLNADGGTIPESAGTYPKSYNFDTEHQLPAPTKNGYSFGGWKVTTADGNWTSGSTYDAYEEGQSGSTYTEMYGDATLTAQWEKETYSITLSLDGGSLPDGVTSPISYDIESTGTLPRPTKTDSSFDGWKVTTAGGSWKTTDEAYAAGTSLTGKYGDVTLTAQWSDLEAVATPAFSPAAGEYTGAQSVEISCATTGATIYYTTDGSDPTTDSSVYSSAISVEEGMTVKALAVKSGMNSSTVASAEYTIKYGVTLNANSGTINSGSISSYTTGIGATLPTDVTRTGYEFGGWYDNSQLSGEAVEAIGETDTGAKTFYAKWEAVGYSITLSLNGGSLPDGVTSPISYDIESTGTLPQPTKTGSSFDGWKVTTADGSWKTTDSAYAAGTSLTGKYGNPTLTAQWSDLEAVATPTFSPAAGEYTGAQSVEISCATTDATIYYTTDGSDPTTNSGVYSSAISVEAGMTVKALAVKENMNNSAIASAEYTIKYGVTLNANGGTINSGSISSYTTGVGATLPTDVTRNGYEFGGWYDNDQLTGVAVTAIADTYTGAKTFYAKWAAVGYSITLSLDGGSLPGGVTSPLSYDIESTGTLPEPVKTDCNFDGWKVTTAGGSWTLNSTFEAGTSLAGKYGDATLTAQWSDKDAVAMPTFSPAAGEYTGAQSVEISCSTTGATIYYTTDGSDPTANSSVYSSAISVATGTTIKAFAVKNDMKNSTVASATYTIKYGVTLNANGGTVNSGDLTEYTTGIGATLPTDVTSDGYDFGGWYDNVQYSGSAVTAIGKGETGEKTFYAKWTLHTYSLTFELDGGSLPAGAANPLSYTIESTDTLPEPTKTDCNFDGWKVTAAGGNWGISSGVSYAAGKSLTEMYGDVTLTAQWSDKDAVATPTFSPAAGEYTGAQSVEISCSTTGATIYYTLDGSDPTANSSVYSSAISVEAGMTVKAFAVKEDMNNSAIASAEYTIKYGVTLNAKGGTVNSGSLTEYISGTGATLPTDVTRDGFEFKGWYENEQLSGDAVTAIGANETGAKTFYAKWEMNTYSVSIKEAPDVSIMTEEKLTLHAETVPSDAEVTWSSENDKIARVDKNGVVTGVGEGETNIKATIYDADDEPVTATCLVSVRLPSTDVYWALENGTLTLSTEGTGARMDDYAPGQAPWYARRAEITNVVIGKGITYIGDNAFFACGALRSVTIAGEGVTVGKRAFAYCLALGKVDTGGNKLAAIGSYGFYACFRLSAQPDAKTVGNKAFELCGIDK